MLKRKRIKLECLDCSSQFVNDYRYRHENALHSGKRVRVQLVENPSNPFEASKKKTPVPFTLPTLCLISLSVEQCHIKVANEKSSTDNMPQNEVPSAVISTTPLQLDMNQPISLQWTQRLSTPSSRPSSNEIKD